MLGRMGLGRALEEETVAHATYRSRVSVEHGATIRQAVETMQREAVGSLLVLDGDRLAGIFTERDLVTRVLGPGRALDTPLADVMTKQPTVTTSDEPIHLALGRMLSGGHRHLPVIDAGGVPIGSISIKRALHFLEDHLPKAIYNLPPEPGRFPARAEGG